MKKRYLKRILPVLLSVCMTVGMTTNSFALQFADTQQHWASNSISKWSDLDVIKGYEGYFRPDDTITRAEFFAILDQIMGYEEQAPNEYNDIFAGDWYHDVMLRLVAAGVVEPYMGGLEPTRNLTRQEEAYYLAKAFRLSPVFGFTEFADDKEIASWSRGSVKALYEYGYIKGYETEEGFDFKPTNNITRAEAIAILDTVVRSFINKPGLYSQNVKGNLLLNTPDVTLRNMVVDGNLYIAEGVGDGDVYLENVTVLGELVVKGGGKNSIHIADSKIANVSVSKKDGSVRIVATGNTKIDVVILESGVEIVTTDLKDGSIKSVVLNDIINPGQAVHLQGKFNSVVSNAKDQAITMQGTIGTLTATQPLNISGNVTVEKLKVSEKTAVAVSDKVTIKAAVVVVTASGGKTAEVAVAVSADGGVAATEVAAKDKEAALGQADSGVAYQPEPTKDPVPTPETTVPSVPQPTPEEIPPVEEIPEPVDPQPTPPAPTPPTPTPPAPTPTPPVYTAEDLKNDKLQALADTLAGKPNANLTGDTSVVVSGGTAGVFEALSIATGLLRDSDVQYTEYNGVKYTGATILDFADALSQQLMATGKYDINFNVHYNNGDVNTTVNYSVSATK